MADKTTCIFPIDRNVLCDQASDARIHHEPGIMRHEFVADVNDDPYGNETVPTDHWGKGCPEGCEIHTAYMADATELFPSASEIADIRERCEAYSVNPKGKRWGKASTIALHDAYQIPKLLDEIERLRAIIQGIREQWHRYNLTNIPETEAKVDATVKLTEGG